MSFIRLTPAERRLLPLHRQNMICLSGQNPERAGLHRHRPFFQKKPPRRETAFVFLPIVSLDEFLDEVLVGNHHSLDEEETTAFEDDNLEGRCIDVEIVHQVFGQLTSIVVSRDIEYHLIGLSDRLQKSVAHRSLARDGLEVVKSKCSFAFQNKICRAETFGMVW